ncbi:MAG: hypothetical protein AAGG01_17215 [Planctomycetota bacterium]
MRWIDRTLGLAFLGVLSLPGIMALHHGDVNAKRTAEIIRRRANPMPSTPSTIAEASGFPGAFDDWFGDAWGGRERALRTHARASMELFGTSPAGFLYFGKKDWVFSSAHKAIESFTGTDPLSEVELLAWQRSLEDRRRWLAERGIDHAFLLVPHKSSIYPELLPDAIRSARGISRREQLYAWMAEHSDVNMIDVAPALIAAKPSPGVLEGADTTLTDIYSPHGVHWSAVGALAGCSAIATFLEQHHGGSPPLNLSDFEVVKLDRSGDSWASRMLLDGVIKMHDLQLRPLQATGIKTGRPPGGSIKDVLSTSENTSLPRVMLSHDSFGTDLRPLLAMHASVLESRWRSWVEQGVVERIRPDIVIEMYSEIVLENRKPYRRPEYLGPEALDEYEAADRVFHVDLTAPLSFDSRPDQQTVTVDGGAVHIDLHKGTARLQIKPPPGGMPDVQALFLGLEISSEAAGTVGIYPGGDLSTMPTEGDAVPLEIGPKVDGNSQLTVVPLLPLAPETNVWIFMPINLKTVTIERIELRATPLDADPR